MGGSTRALVVGGAGRLLPAGGFGGTASGRAAVSCHARRQGWCLISKAARGFTGLHLSSDAASVEKVPKGGNIVHN